MSWSNIISLRDIAEGTVSAPPPLWHDFILDRSLILLTAPPFTGKSLLSAAMAISLDCQLPLFGRFAPNGVKRSLCILQDAPTWDYAEQFRKLMRGYRIDREMMPLLESTLVVNSGIQVTDKDFREELTKFHTDSPFDVLFFDAFWTIHSLDENSNSQMGYVMNQLKWIRDHFHVAVVITHHERKFSQLDGPSNSNYRSRGSTVIPAACDFVFNLSRTKNRIKVEPAKGRGADSDAIVVYDINEVDHPDGIALRLEAVTESSRRDHLIRLLATGPKNRGAMADLYKTLGMTTARAAKAVDNDLMLLSQEQRVKRAERGHWELT